MILVIKFVLAFCSIAYELVLAQSLAAFLENTALRYSVTIGLYLFAMGLGAFFIDRRMNNPWRSLWRTEMALTVVGALSVPALFFVDHFAASRMAFALSAHGLIVLIGFLTGFELPLLLKIAEAKKEFVRHKVIAVDYAGAFVGSLMFVFVFYSWVGLIPAVLWISLLNAGMGLVVLRLWSPSEKSAGVVWGVQFVILAILVAALVWSSGIESSLLKFYIG